MEGYVVPIVVALFGSGIWTFIMDWIKLRSNRMTVEKKMLLGLGRDRLYEKLEACLARGYTTADELENIEALYVPYRELGGNGTCERMYERVNALPHGDK